MTTRLLGNWSNPEIPKDGWVIVAHRDYSAEHSEGVSDGPKLGPYRCMMCLTQWPVRIEILQHPQWEKFKHALWIGEPSPFGLMDGMHVGCECAGHMTADVEGARERFANYAAQSRKKKATALKVAREQEAALKKAEREAKRAARRALNAQRDPLADKAPGTVLLVQKVRAEEKRLQARARRMAEAREVVEEFKQQLRQHWHNGVTAYPAQKGYYVLNNLNDYYWIDWRPTAKPWPYTRLSFTHKSEEERDAIFDAALHAAYINDTTIWEALGVVTRFAPTTGEDLRERRKQKYG